jgi:hypothetical protein
MFTKKTIIIMSAIIVALLIFIVGILFWKTSPANIANNLTPPVITEEIPKSSIEAGKEKTQNLIEEAKKLAAGIGPGKIAQEITVNRTDVASGTVAEKAVVVAPQSNPISEKTGEVLTRDGTEVAKTGIQAGDANAPLQSAPIDPSKLPASAIKITINPESIVPATFTVSPGQVVVLSVTAASSVEVFKFDDPSLSAVAMGLMPRQTLAINFNAPAKLGEYTFYSDFSGHRQTGAVGKMIVK